MGTAGGWNFHVGANRLRRDLMRKSLKVWKLLGLLPVGVALSVGAAAVPHDQQAQGEWPGVTHASPSKQPSMVTVDGHASGTLQLFGFEGDTVTFRVDARADADAPWAATGSFDVSHVQPDGTVLADFGGTVDCLMAGADVAVLSGTITRGGAVGLPGEELGHKVGLTIADRGSRHDRLGWSWLVMQFDDAPPCMSTAPFFPVADGDFRVHEPRLAHRQFSNGQR